LRLEPSASSPRFSTSETEGFCERLDRLPAANGGAREDRSRRKGPQERSDAFRLTLPTLVERAQPVFAAPLVPVASTRVADEEDPHA